MPITDTASQQQAPEEVEFLRQQQLKFLKSMEGSADNTFELIKQLKESLITNATGTLGAYNRVLTIYTVSFIIGVLLIITGVVFGAMGKNVLAIAFGTLGLIDMVTYFIKLPANKIQESRSNLSQLQVVLLTWMSDFVNTNTLMSIKQATITLEEYKFLSDMNIENTTRLLRLIEEVAEPKN